MATYKIPRLVFAAAHSGSGKTTVTMGIIAALKRQGMHVQAYKIGPDYIDPGYHKIASGKPVHNLDTWLTPEKELMEFFTKTSKGADIAIIEGVMGLYDGGKNGISSTAEIAKKLKAPVILVLDVKSMGDSAAAIALGFKNYDLEIDIAGVILNRVASQSHESMIRQAMSKIGISVIGVVYRDTALIIPERHLGLTPTTENEMTNIVDIISKTIASEINLTQMMAMAYTAKEIELEEVSNLKTKKQCPIKIGVASDEAFSFYYEESLSVLEEKGAEIIPFSPLKDEAIPCVDGLIFGGGFPEMFAGQLANNRKMKKSIEMANAEGMPIYAECGGFMYLTESLCDFSNQIYDMVGLIPAVCQINKNLQTVGYVEGECLSDNLIAQKGDLLRGHEFHFSSTEPTVDFPWAFIMKKVRTGVKYYAGYAQNNLLASYLHLHFAGNKELAENFIKKCETFSILKDKKLRQIK